MSRFWKKFFKRLVKQVSTVFRVVLILSVIVLGAIIWISTGALFSHTLTSFTSIPQDDANTLGIIFAISWPIALVWFINTVVSVQAEIEKENEKILEDIRSSRN